MISPIRLGAVTYLNARPLVYGLASSPLVSLRFDLPSRCADLLHAGAIDLGLIPSIEYLRPPASHRYAIVPDVAIASHGPVASVAVYTTRPVDEIRSIALDTSSRTSVALVRVLCARVFHIAPSLEHHEPDLAGMLRRSDAALIIGDNALLQGDGRVRNEGQTREDGPALTVTKLDLGEIWTRATGLPFVYAFWTGVADNAAIDGRLVHGLQDARDRGIAHADEVAAEYFADAPERHAMGARYLRDNIKYSFGAAEHAGLELFYRYAFEVGAVDTLEPLRYFSR